MDRRFGFVTLCVFSTLSLMSTTVNATVLVIPGEKVPPPNCESALRKLAEKSNGKIIIGDTLSTIVVQKRRKGGAATLVFNRKGSSEIDGLKCKFSPNTTIENGIVEALKQSAGPRGLRPMEERPPQDIPRGTESGGVAKQPVPRQAVPNKPRSSDISSSDVRYYNPDAYQAAVEACSREFPKVGGELESTKGGSEIMKPLGQPALKPALNTTPGRS